MKIKWKVMLRVIIYHKKLSVYEKMMGCWEKKIVFEWKTNLLKIIPKCRTLNAWASLNGNPFMKIFYSSNSYFLLLFHTQTSFQSFTFFYSIFYISLFSLLYFSTFFAVKKSTFYSFIHSINKINFTLDIILLNALNVLWGHNNERTLNSVLQILIK